MGHPMLDQIIRNNFPQTGLSLAFGYGSRVLRQAGGIRSENDLVDIIFVVDDSLEWHKQNLSRNGQHYGLLRHSSRNAELITNVQEKYGGYVYFNPYVDIANISIKYGVIRTGQLIEDLNEWSKIYIAGRLHKPVEFLIYNNDSLRSALRFNKESALRAALLQLPETFEPIELYRIITGLSYHGDVRMLIGEDRNKIDNIVSKQIKRFDQLYMPIIKLSQNFKESVHWNDNKKVFTQDLSSATLLKNLKLLPRRIRNRICEYHGREARTVECDIVLGSLSKNINCDKVVAKAISSIVRQSSFSQSLKGLLTAGLFKSLKYSQAKLTKSLVSRLPRSI